MKKFADLKFRFGICLAAVAAPATAHHSFAMFDQNRQVELKNVTVTRFEWTNPHSFVYVKDGTTTYMLECSSPNLMTHQGWKFNTLKTGDEIGIIFYPLRNGKPGGMLKTVKFPSGQSLNAW